MQTLRRSSPGPPHRWTHRPRRAPAERDRDDGQPEARGRAGACDRCLVGRPSGSCPRLVVPTEEQQGDDAAIKAAPTAAAPWATSCTTTERKNSKAITAAAPQRQVRGPPGMQQLELCADAQRDDREDHDPADVDADLEAEDPRDGDAVGEQREHRQVGRDVGWAGDGGPSRHRRARRGAARTRRPAADPAAPPREPR